MASTVLPNGIIIPEKFSRDWYADLYHNWQELDNLLGGGTPKDGTLTIQKNGATVGTFSANQATNETINITVPDVNDATLTIQKNGTTVDTFTANSSTDKTVDITVPTKTSDLTNDSGFITEDTTKIPLAGSNQISGSLIPATDNSINIGSSTKNIKMLYTKGITIDGTQFVPSNYIPISGGAVITGSNLSRIDDTNALALRGGSGYNKGAQLTLYGKDANGYEGAIYLLASDGNTVSQFTIKPVDALATISCTVFRPYGNPTLGEASYKWGQIYSTNSTISTSDARLKNSVKDIDDKLLDAWENVEPKQYKFNDATEKKGEKARYHTGYLAQDIQVECEKQGVNASDYGLFCYDEWEEQEEKKDENGQVIEPYRANGDLYSLRYEEALVVECMYLRRCIARLTARIEELEKGNNTK